MLEHSVTIKAESVEKAIRLGLTKLNLTQEEATINVISEGKKGLFGFGRQDAIVEVSANKKASLADLTEEISVSTTEEAEEIVMEKVVEEVPIEADVEATIAAEVTTEEDEVEFSEDSVEEDTSSNQASLEEIARYLERVIKAYGADSTVTVTSKARQVTFNITTDKSGLIIGKHGKTIDALQTLAQVMVHHNNNRRTMVLINVGDYRDRRAGVLERIAERTAAQVLRTKQAVILDPLPAYERKQIHAYLSKVDHIETHSEGTEPNRYLVVEYVS